MTELNVNIDLNTLCKFKIFDKNGDKLGRVIDFCFSKEYKLTKFIVGGSYFEELRESLNLKPDDDPVFSISDIASVDVTNKKIILDTSNSELTHKLEKNAFNDNEELFSAIKKHKVVSYDNSKVGKIVDAIFTKDNDVSFILGDSVLVEFLEKIGITANYDLLLPNKFIAERKEKEIVISQTKDQLKVLLDNEEVAYKPADLGQLEKDKLHSQVSRYTSTQRF